MKTIKLYNSLTRKKEEFKPIIKGEVGLYTCGPTVYNYAHIGNLRTYIFEDILKRVLAYNGFRVKHVMNITDVGHLTSDRDSGEDKLEKGARREGKSAWEIAEYYTQAFKRDLRSLNILEPDIWCKATDYIKEQIQMIKTLEKKGYTYRISDGIYFDTSQFKNYNKLSHQKLEALEEGARVEANPEKRQATDFALWKFSPAGSRRQMEWDSPWGKGFPGWHLECSAMSLKCLGKQLDIHCGGVDHIDVHHTNEIAQSEAATGEKFFNYWMHGAFLNVAGGKKMAKSADNFLTIENALEKKGINPMVYRFASFQTHYRKPMEYSEEAISSAKNGYEHLQNQVRELGAEVGRADKVFREKFLNAINDDLNMPKALAIAQSLLKSKIANKIKLASILDMDNVFGLKLDNLLLAEVPDEIRKLAEEREIARKNKDFEEADRTREKLKILGYEIEDTNQGFRVFKK